MTNVKNNENNDEVFAQNAIKFSKPANNLLTEGTIGGQKFSFLIETGASVSAIRADVWRQLPPPVKHPPILIHVKTFRAVNGQNIPVLGRVEVPFQIQSKTYPYFSSAQIAAPSNKLTSKNVKFQWDESCQFAFDKLKRALTSAPILAYPDFHLPLHLYVIASQDGIGLTLGQLVDGKDVVIAYAGRD